MDWAIARKIPHAGWCPLGRLAEDGALPAKYQLKETPTAEYAERTFWNVRDSDGTAIFSIAQELSGGSLATAHFARQLHKPFLHLSRATRHPAARLRAFVAKHRIKVLNVAGPRASLVADIGQFVQETLEEALGGLT